MESNTAREEIFSSIRESLVDRESREPYPEYEASDLVAEPRLQSGDNLWEDFGRNFSAVNGRAMDSLVLLMTWLHERDYLAGYCAPEIYATLGRALEGEGFEIECQFDRNDFERYQFGITRGSGAIAETGSVILTDKDTSDRLGALVPWVHISVIRPNQIYRTLPDAIANFPKEEHNIIWATGPSKTADIEGILIEGVHGPGEQICLALADF